MENASLPPSSRPLRFSCEQNKSVSCSTRQISIQTSLVSQAVIRMAGAGPMMAATTTIGGPPILLVSDDGNELPKLPEKRPQSARERHGIARAITRYLREASHTFRLAIWIARAAWLADEAARDITTYFDEPKTLEELRDAVDDPEKGYDIHHIVEQGPARSDGFPETQIQSRLNKVRIPRFKHWEINGWYGRPIKTLEGYLPGNIFVGLAGKSGPELV